MVPGLDSQQAPGTWMPELLDLGASFFGQVAPRSGDASAFLLVLFDDLGDLGASF
jgi:hypothetical protein